MSDRAEAWRLDLFGEERWIKLGPVRTRYFQGGNPSGPTVVLIHEGGFGGDAPNTYDLLGRRLTEDYHLLVPEMLGFGGTDKAVFFGESPYEPRIRHLSCFLDALDVTNAHFVGNSFGGGMVLRLSIKQETSWRMRSATSISGTGGPFRTEAALRELADYAPSKADARKVDGWILTPDTQSDEHAQLRLDSSLRPGQWESMMAPTLRSPAVSDQPRPWDFPDALSASQIPTLLVAGTQDRMLESGWEKRLAEHLSDCTLRYLDAGHSPNISHPDATAGLLREFFASVESRQRAEAR